MVERLEEEYLLDNSSFKSDHLRIDTDKLKPAKHNLLSEHRLANQKSSNRCLNILFVNRITQQLQHSTQFEQMLVNDKSNNTISFITMMGSHQIGKSFLLDCIISRQEGLVSRCMCKKSKPLVNTASYPCRNNNNELLRFLDCEGNCANDTFLWCYFLSSTMVLNLACSDRLGQQHFFGNLAYAMTRRMMDTAELSQPQLIVVRRDADGRQIDQGNFIRKIMQYELFSQVKLVKITYPGTETVTNREIVDVPAKLLDQHFLKDVDNLCLLIKTSQPKVIKRNYINAKIAGLVLQPLTKGINKQHKISTNKIWEDVMETLSVNYYNLYLKKHSEELQVLFADERPVGKYTLYKKLNRAKISVDRKTKAFVSLSNDETFQQYREKLTETIARKEGMIRDINRQKSKEENERNCRNTLERVNRDSGNVAAAIETYASVPLNQHKTDVLLTSFLGYVESQMNNQRMNKLQSTSMKQIEEELKETEFFIEKQSKVSAPVSNVDLPALKANLAAKQQTLATVHKNIAQEKQKLSSKPNNQQSSSLRQMQQRITQLKSQLKTQNTTIQKLQSQKDTEVRSEMTKLEAQLAAKQDKLKALQAKLRTEQNKAGAGVKPPQQSRTCCCIIM